MNTKVTQLDVFPRRKFASFMLLNSSSYIKGKNLLIKNLLCFEKKPISEFLLILLPHLNHHHRLSKFYTFFIDSNFFILLLLFRQKIRTNNHVEMYLEYT